MSAALTRMLTIASGGVAQPLLFEQVTSSRATEAWLQIAAPTDGTTSWFDWAAPYAPRIFDRGDGKGTFLVGERSVTVVNQHNRDLTLSPNAAIGTVTRTANFAPGGDGVGTVRVTMPAGSNELDNANSAQIPGAPQVGFGLYRSPTSTPTAGCLSIYLGGSLASYASKGIAALTPIWQPIQTFVETYGGGHSTLIVNETTDRTSVGGLPAGARDACVDLLMVHAGRYAHTPVRQTGFGGTAGVSVAADGNTMPAPAWFFSTPTISINFITPFFSNTTLVSGDIRWVFTIDDANSGLRFRHDGTGVLLEALQGGVVKAASGYLVFGINSYINNIVIDRAGTITVNGVAGAVGTAWTWAGTTLGLMCIVNAIGTNDGDCGLGGVYPGTNGGPALTTPIIVAIDSCTLGNSIEAAGTPTIGNYVGNVQTVFNASADRRYNPIGGFISAAVPVVPGFTFSFNGYGTAQLLALITTFNLPAEYANGRRKLVLTFCIGTNDITAGTPNATIQSNTVALAQAYAAKFPTALIVIQKLLPRLDAKAAVLTDYNANYVPGIVTALVAGGVNAILDDALSLIPGVIYLGDGVHPSAAAGMGPYMGGDMQPVYERWMDIAASR